MKIQILTGHFVPQLHPRAFRANELALEFVRQGHTVCVTNCWTIYGFDYADYAKKAGIEIRNLNIFVTNKDAKKQGGKGRIISFLKEYLLAGSLFYRGPLIAEKLVIDPDTDLVIALSTPFTCLYALSLYYKNHRKKCITIADSGDPFYGSKQTPKAPWFKWIEKRVYKYFDYLSIPTENAVPIYQSLINPEKILIIPQGFNMKNVRLCNEPLSDPVKFAYAGVFYKDIRNPEFLFSFLASIAQDFQFYIYMRENDSYVDSLIIKHPNIKDKIRIVYSLPREQLLYELSKKHFLINIDNLSSTQIPSKVIDYAISKRPIYSCNEKSFSANVFNQFMAGDYSRQLVLDISKYEIGNVAKQFLDAYYQKK